eukprot:m.9221 g.9221  ORF g.9221 m.9221 type:complete len:830 (-) comp2377_c0_seq2:738-3227(-)
METLHRTQPLPDILRSMETRREPPRHVVASKTPVRTMRMPSVETETAAGLDDARGSTVNMDKILKLLTHRHSITNVDRHVHVLNKLARNLEAGAAYEDLSQLLEVIRICHLRASEGNAAYSDPTADIVQQLAHPFIGPPCEPHVLVPIIEAVVALLADPTAALTVAASMTVVAWHEQIMAAPAALLATACLQARFAQRIADLLPAMTIDIRLPILEALADLAHAPEHIAALGDASSAEFLCGMIADPETNGLQDCANANDIIVSILAEAPGSKFVQLLFTAPCASLFRDAVRRTTIAADGAAARQHRNDVTVTVLLVAGQPAGLAALQESGLLDVLVRFATWTEAGRRHPDTKNLRLGAGTDDYEFHKVLLTLAVKLAAHAPADSPAAGKLLGLLFAQIDADASSSRWTPVQQEELRLQSLAAVGAVAAAHLEAYREQRGNTRLLGLLERVLNPDSKAASSAVANSFFNGTELRNGLLGAHTDFSLSWPQRPLARMVLRALARVCQADSGPLRCDLGDQGALTQIVAFLERPLVASAEIVDVTMRTDALRLAAALCQADPHNKELFGVSGVYVVLSYLQPPADVVKVVPEWGLLFGAAVDCVWSCIVNCALTESAFLAREGALILLDILQTSPPLRGLVLGVLSDLTERAPAVEHLRAWRGRGGQSTAELLLELWRAEEPPREGASGVIEDVPNPLVHPQRRTSGAIGVASVDDVFENSRAKIYSLLNRMGLDSLASTLPSSRDRITLVAVCNYLRLKRGEVWIEIEQELQKEGVQPVEVDAELLAHMQTVNLELVRRIRAEQASILEHAAREELQAEQATYEKILRTP